MQQPASIFNDVIGPVMIGPSSSHTAGSVRIGRMLRALLGDAPEKVKFRFSESGIIAYTYHGQGSDFGLSGGLLGYETFDPRIVPSLNEAAEKGIDISFEIIEEDLATVSVYRVLASGGGVEIHTDIDSMGGGMIEMISFMGIPVSIDGGFYEYLLLSPSETIAAANARAMAIKARLPETAAAYVSQGADGATLINIKSERPLSGEEWAEYTSLSVYAMPPILPVPGRITYEGLWNTEAETLRLWEQDKSLDLADLAVLYETRRSGLSAEAVRTKMEQIVETLMQTIQRSAARRDAQKDSILPRQAYLLDNAPKIEGDAYNNAIKTITLLMEAKTAMDVIVAAPTGGSCAALPGTLIGVGQTLSKTTAEIAHAMLAAGLVGVFIATHSTFNGEAGGCQAECGAGSGMAAAGLVTLMGGNVRQALDAAAMALQNVLGMVCDTVADRVEVPCLGKNIIAGMNAIAMANLGLAGFDKVIPLDETIGAADEVCHMIPYELRSVGLAGLSVTKTSKDIWRRLNPC